MEIITLDQPTYKKSKKDGKEHIYLYYIYLTPFILNGSTFF